MTRVLVDSDYFAYSIGATVQHTLYDCSALLPDGTTDETVAPTAIDRDAWMASGFPDGTQFQVDRLIEAEPESHAIFLVKRVLSSIERRLEEAGVSYRNLELFLTGDGNFRDTLATIKPYKGNRDRASRPVHYQAIRRYLRRAWGAVTVDGYEADDALAMVASNYGYDPERVIICTVDKDLKTVPGRLYNYTTKTWATVSKQDALVNFYRQLLVGDTVDNIGGCWKVGEKGAEFHIVPTMTERDMYTMTLDLYRKSLAVKGCPYVEMGAEAALLENARLLHLLRFESDVWMPPT